MPDRPPVVLEVALNGLTSQARNPRVPLRPDEIAADARACLDAGAAIVHTHAHGAAATPEAAAAVYLEAYRPVLAARPDAILYPTIGVGGSIAERWDHHETLARAGGIRCGVVDPGAVVLAETGADGLPSVDYVYAHTPSEVRYAMEGCRRLGLGPSVAVFEPGYLRSVLAWANAGRLPPGTFVKLYFAERGYFHGGEALFGPPPIREALDLYLAMLGDAPLPWAVAVLGGSLLESPLAALALARGGHLRVGIEDDPDAAGNVAQVERAAALVAAHGRRLATPAEAARILGLPTA